MKNKKWIVIGAIILIVALVAARNLNKKAKNGKEAGAEVGVVVTKVSSGTLASEVTVAGTVKSELEVNLVPKAAGKVMSVAVDVGAQVRKGQVLIRLDGSDYRGALKQAEAGLVGAKARLRQVEAGASSYDLKQAQAQVNQARASMEGAEKALAAAKSQYQDRTGTQSQVDAASTQVAVSEAAVNSARTGLASARARSDSAQSNLRRMEQLYNQDAITRQQLEGAQLEANLAASQVDAALSALRQAEAGLEGSRKGLSSAQSFHSNRIPSQQQIDGAQSQLEMAKAAYDAAQARYSQLQAGARGEEVAVVRSAVLQAEASVEQARTQLANTTITSPIDGVVAQRLINPGEMAGPGQPVLILVQANRLTMEGQVSENIVPYLKEGQSAFVEVDAFPGEQLLGTVKNLAPAADPRTKAFLIRVALAEASGLKAGMMGRITLTTDSRADVLKVPRTAILNRGGKDYVFVVKAGKAQRIPVELGLATDTEIEIRSGLKKGEQVVSRGAESLISGTEVVVLEGAKN
jgi:HlyD family secretion protein